MTSLKAALRELAPPVLWRLARRLRRPVAPPPPEFERVPETWMSGAPSELGGWDAEQIRARYRAKWPRFKEMVAGPGPLGFTHEGALATREDLASHNTVVTFAYVAALAAREAEPLTVLDWGGGSGHYALLARAVLPGAEVVYACKDVPGLVRLGEELLPGGTFYDDDAWAEQDYDLVVASGALHYAPDWRATLGQLARSARRYLFVTRLPIVEGTPSFAFVQRPDPAYGYDSQFVGWCLSREAFLGAAAEAGAVLVREFVVGEEWPVAGAPAPLRVRGFLFRCGGPAGP